MNLRYEFRYATKHQIEDALYDRGMFLSNNNSLTYKETNLAFSVFWAETFWLCDFWEFFEKITGNILEKGMIHDQNKGEKYT